MGRDKMLKNIQNWEWGIGARDQVNFLTLLHLGVISIQKRYILEEISNLKNVSC
jgi:hypothetical protein